MLFEEFVEQHRVYLVVTHAQGFAVFGTRHQVGVYLFYFPGNQTKSEGTRRFNVRLVAEAYRPEAVNGFTGLIDQPDFILETRRPDRRGRMGTGPTAITTVTRATDLIVPLRSRRDWN